MWALDGCLLCFFGYLWRIFQYLPQTCESLPQSIYSYLFRIYGYLNLWLCYLSSWLILWYNLPTSKTYIYNLQLLKLALRQVRIFTSSNILNLFFACIFVIGILNFAVNEAAIATHIWLLLLFPLRRIRSCRLITCIPPSFLSSAAQRVRSKTRSSGQGITPIVIIMFGFDIFHDLLRWFTIHRRLRHWTLTIHHSKLVHVWFQLGLWLGYYKKMLDTIKQGIYKVFENKLF